MENGSYQLDSTINYGPPVNAPSPSKQTATFPVQGKFVSGKNYTVFYGFKDIPAKNFFALKINTDKMTFGRITPGEALQRTITQDIIPGSSTGFQLFAFEDHSPLDKAKKVSVPDTTCDNGNCTNALTDTWNSPLTYGFGFRCDSKDSICSTAFLETGVYRKLPSLEFGDNALPFAYGLGIKPKQVTTTYKINIPGSQPEGIYQNKITLLASPLF